MSYKEVQGLAILSQTLPDDDKDDFVFESFPRNASTTRKSEDTGTKTMPEVPDSLKTPKIDNHQYQQITPITQLQKEIIEENSPARSIDSLGFKQIIPLSVGNNDLEYDQSIEAAHTSPLHLKNSQTEEKIDEAPLGISGFASQHTLNTFYSAQSIHSSTSDGFVHHDDNDDTEQYQSALNLNEKLAKDDHTADEDSEDTTVDTDQLFSSNEMGVSPKADKNEAKFLMFTNQFSEDKHGSSFTARTTASSYYGDYNDGYSHGEIDNDKTPLITTRGKGEIFENIIQEEDNEDAFDDLNKTPLVRQVGFENNPTPKVDPVVPIPPPTTSSTSTVTNSATSYVKANATTPVLSKEIPVLKKANNGKLFSKFKRKIKHSRGQSVNGSANSDQKDLTSMDNDAAPDLVNVASYKAYASTVSPPPPPPPQNNVEDVDDFNFVSPSNIASTNNHNIEGVSSQSTLDQKSQTTQEAIVMDAPNDNIIPHDEDDDDLYHTFKPNEKSIDQLLTPANTVNGSLGAHAHIKSASDNSNKYSDHYEDGDEVHIENLSEKDIAVSVNSKKDLKLSPAKSIRKGSPPAKTIKSPNELNKDIFENFRPSYMQENNTVASPTSSFYPDNDSPATNQFSVGTSQLDKRDFVSPTESTFSSTSEKRHTQVKLLNRSTTNLRNVSNNIAEEADKEEEEEEEEEVEITPRVHRENHQKSISNEERITNDADIQKELANHEDDNYARLFLTATHPFDSQSLESQDEAARCLSFQKDDIAFIHDISESSGWAEVTLLSYKIETGWVPLNYFKPTIDDRDKEPLILLFKSAGNFLSNRQSRPIYSSRTGELKGYSFSYATIDKITIGLKYFLREIGCLSSKNENVYLSKIIREVRKKLLQDWHILRQKSRDYVGTMNVSKIELLELLVYQVLMKAIMFLNIWKTENILKPKSNLNRFKLNSKSMTYLSYTPTLRERVKEDSTIFFSYFSLIIGRMDLIEHNLTGINLLKIINDHIDALYLDFKFVVTESTKVIRDDRFLDPLDSFGKLIEIFDRDCFDLINLTKREFENGRLAYAINHSNNITYAYTECGKKLLITCAKLILELNKIMPIEISFAKDRAKVKVEHQYPDFQRFKIDATDFIKEASIGLLESNKFNEQLKKRKGVVTPKSKSAKRFSIFRSGNTESLALTPEGMDLLGEMMVNDEQAASPLFTKGEFKELTDDKNLKDNPYYIKNLSNEILKDSNGVLIGSSFRGLVYFLTNELDDPNQLYISTFFLCYKIFSSGEDLLDAFITRFESNVKETQSSADIRIKNRRKLVLKMITIWLSSYWNRKDDFRLLPKLMNFLNECASDFLPLETLQLIKLVASVVTSSKDGQLTPRPLLPIDEKQDSRFSMIMMSTDDDDYELTLIQSNESLNSLASISSSALSRTDVQEIEGINSNYRSFIGASWPSTSSLNDLIANWYHNRNTRLRFPSKALAVLNYHSLDIAKQLTLIESELFNSIKIEELLNENFTEKKVHLNLSPNVQKSILFTNSLSEYVLETILQPDLSLKQRVKILTKWLKIALNCFNLKNFNSLASIMTSLQSFLISRCVKIWNLLNGNYKKLFEKLIKIIQPDKNYLIYRKKLLNYLNDKNQIIVPYLNLFLQDLTFIVEGNPNYRSAKTFLNQKLINIDKYFKITKILGDLQKLQKNYKTTTTPNDYLKKSTSSSSMIRKSLSRLSLSSITDLNMDVVEIFPLQELIFLELLRVRQLNLVDDDRSWKLSCLIQPREG